MLTRKQKKVILAAISAAIILISFTAYTYHESKTLPDSYYLKNTVKVSNFNEFVLKSTNGLSTPDIFFKLGNSYANAEYIMSFVTNPVWDPGPRIITLYLGMVNETLNWPCNAIIVSLEHSNIVYVNGSAFHEEPQPFFPMLQATNIGNNISMGAFPVNDVNYYLISGQYNSSQQLPPTYNFTIGFSLGFTSIIEAGPYHFKGNSTKLTGSYEVKVNETASVLVGNVTRIG